MFSFRNISSTLFIGVVAFGLTAGAGVAGEVGRGFMALGSAAAAPPGFLDFCRRSPMDCAEGPNQVQADIDEVRRQASRLYWAGVFGGPSAAGDPAPAAAPRNRRDSGPGSVGRLVPLEAAPDYDWRRMSALLSFVSPVAASPAPVLTAELSESPPSIEGAEEGATSEAADTADAGRDPALAGTRWPQASLDAEGWRRVRTINRRVNRQIRHTSDARQYGREDFWQIPGADGRGDCEDYVLAKRRELIRAGVSVAALSIAVVQTRWGESHAVLLLATPEGEYVLDNLTSRIKRWDQVDYEWRERQAPGSTFEWVNVAG